METKHTHGPWTNGGENRHFGYSVNAPGSKPEYHVTVCEVMGQDTAAATEANTQLIVSAPEMYALIVKLDRFFDGWCPSTCNCASEAKPLHDEIMELREKVER